MWIANTQDGTVTRIPSDRDRLIPIPVGGRPTGMAFGAGSLWVADGDSRNVAQVDPGTNAVTQRIDVGNAPRALAAGYGALWVASSADSAVRRVDLRGGTVSRRIPLSSGATAIAAGAGAIWVASEEAGTVTRVDPASGTAEEVISVGHGPSAVAVGEGAVWVTSRDDGTLWRIDPATNAVSWSVHVGGDPVGVAAAAGSVWVVSNSAGTMTRVHPHEPRVLDRRAVGGSPAGVAVADGTAWVPAGAPPSSHRGGTLRVLYSIGNPARVRLPMDWLDPGGYNGETLQLVSLAYDGLVAYRRVGANGRTAALVGALATRAPPPSPDGLTYVFTLRPGLRYSDGRAVRPEDFRVSLERFLQVTRTAGFPPYFASVVGAERCMREKGACDLSNGIETDPRARTITVHLTQPDGDFLDKLTQTWAFVVPADTPRRRFGVHMPPGTGPYRFASWDVAKGGHLVRNPYFDTSRGRPAGFVDRIDVRVDPGERTPAEATEVQRGAADLMELSEVGSPQFPLSRLHALAAAAPGQIHTRPGPWLIYMYLNLRRAPFDDPRVRRALNYATDRARVVDIRGGPERGVATCQILPTGFPGHEPYCPYTARPGAGRAWSAPDMERARRLVAESGTAGQRVVLFMPDFAKDIGRYYVKLLDDLGYRASMRVVAYAGWNPYKTHWQIGFLAWGADFPRPSGFIEPMFDCSSPGSTNPSYFCIDRYARQLREAHAARGADAQKRWAALDRKVTDLAPVVPLENDRNLVLVSKRVGNVQNFPEGPLLDQMWVR
jgi:YVTN family beta-propeller protein